MARVEPGERVLATNRKAFFQYEVLERAEAGLALVGTEVKSIRDGGLNFSDSYVDVPRGRALPRRLPRRPYSHGNLMNHVPDRDRKLLLHRREILKLGGKVAERGLTLVPLRAYLKNGRVEDGDRPRPGQARPRTSAKPSRRRTRSGRCAWGSGGAGCPPGGEAGPLARYLRSVVRCCCCSPSRNTGHPTSRE